MDTRRLLSRLCTLPRWLSFIGINLSALTIKSYHRALTFEHCNSLEPFRRNWRKYMLHYFDHFASFIYVRSFSCLFLVSPLQTSKLRFQYNALVSFHAIQQQLASAYSHQMHPYLYLETALLFQLPAQMPFETKSHSVYICLSLDKQKWRFWKYITWLAGADSHWHFSILL